MILKLLGCYANPGCYKVNVTGSVGGILIEINKRIEVYTCHRNVISHLVLWYSRFRKI